MEQLREQLQLLIAARQRLATVVSREQRSYTLDEIRQLSELHGAISAVLQTLHEMGSQQGHHIANSSATDDRLVAANIYQARREVYRLTSQVTAEYGRWLIATIAAVHFGGIYLLSNAADPAPGARQEATWALIIGIILILLCGLFAWFNWATHSTRFRFSDANMLIDPQSEPVDSKWQIRVINFTHWSCIVLGLLSVACIPWAAFVFLGGPPLM
jgi:hypothetical protein